MGDVAQILKDTKVDHDLPSKAMQIAGIPKDVISLLCGKQDPLSAALPPMVPSFTSNEVKVKIGNKTISSSKPARQWTWAPFSSSSRTDGAMFSHWVRANVEYTDYPYAKFDIHLDPVIYTDEDYEALLKDDGWTKSETDKLLDLCRTFELRWPVIHDRWLEFYDSDQGGTAPMRKKEDLQERYYSVAAILAQARIRQQAAAEVQALTSVQHEHTAPNAAEKVDQNLLETAAARALATAAPTAQTLMINLGTGSTNKTFDASSERVRTARIDRMWKRSKKEEQEEMELRKELRDIETHLRKLKKLGGHVLAASGSRMSMVPNSRHAARAATPLPGSAIVDNPELLDQSFSSTAPQPMPQNPYLQSGRLIPPAAGGTSGINKTMLTRMQQVMTELKIPLRPLPTKRVCDLYDSVRKDILTLITLQKMVLQKEGTLHAKRVKLSKLGPADGKVLDEEELLGLSTPPAPPLPAQATGAKKSTKPTALGGKAKTAPVGTKANTSDKPKPGNEGKDDAKKKTVNRKRKVDEKEPPAKKGPAVGVEAEAVVKTPQKETDVPGTKSAVAAPATVPASVKALKASKATPEAVPQDSSAKKRARKS